MDEFIALHQFARLAVFVLAGLLLGSFAAVAVVRGPRVWGLVDDEELKEKEGLAWPPSHCMSCHARLRPWHLIPVFSYLALSGRCNKCASRISPLYPTVEILCGLSGAAAALLFVGNAAAAVSLIASTLLITAAAIDQRTGYLPDALTLPLTALGFSAAAFGLFGAPVDAIWGWVAGWGGLALLGAVYREVRGREGLGGGDAKLLGAGGTFVGATALPVVLLVAAGSALAYVLASQRGKVAGQQEIRFGPWLAGGIAAAFAVKAAFPALFP